MWNSNYMMLKSMNKLIYVDGNQIVFASGGEEEGEIMTGRVQKGIFEVLTMFCILIELRVAWVYHLSKLIKWFI